MYQLPDALAPLAAWRQFVLVRIAPKPDGRGGTVTGKTNKFSTWPHQAPKTAIGQEGQPYAVNFGDNCDAHNPDCWLTWQEAAALAARMPIYGDTTAWHVGFVITAADPFACLDIDSCATLNGTWNDTAQVMMQRKPGAVELSISGQGLHIWSWYLGAPPPHGKRNAALGIELYTEKRFICLGHGATGAMVDSTAVLPNFCTGFFPAQSELAVDDWSTGPCPEYTVLTDDELMHMAMARTRQQEPGATFGQSIILPSFSDLWTRKMDVMQSAFRTNEPHKEYDYSEADFSLAKELAYWTGKDCARIERLIHGSTLKRDKWDERRKGGTYLTETIGRAVAACQRVYTRKPIMPAAPPAVVDGVDGKLAPQVIEHETFIFREGLVELFAGCVYVQDQNMVLLANGDLVDQARFNARFAGYAFGMDKHAEKTTKSAWECFLANQAVRFPRVEGTEFNPRLEFQHVTSRGGRDWVNTYKAPKVDRAPGDTAPFMELLRKLLPHGDDAIILLSYMAAVVQYPGIKFRWAPFIQGAMGNGKSTVVSCLKHALGHKYVYPIKVGQIENNFNAWLENHVLYIADDIYSSKDRTDMMEALKGLITETDQSITYKGIDSISKRIVGNFLFMDNHRDAMQKRDGTRRICTLYCAQQTSYDRFRDGLTKEYFVRTLIPYLENGGYRAVSEMLHTMVIDPRYNPAGECQEAPETSTTAEAIEDGRTGLESQVGEWIELEEPGFCGGFVSYHMLTAKLKTMPQYQRSAVPLKIQELMQRLGYIKHPGLTKGRLPHFVQPDDTKPILYVKIGTMQAAQTDADMIAALYIRAQADALTAQTARRFGGMAA